MELPLTIESLLKIIANKDEVFAKDCREKIINNFNKEDRNYWFNNVAWLEQSLKTINLENRVKEKKVEVDLLKTKYLFPHMAVLLRKRKELVWVEENDYGTKTICDLAWNNEIEHFIITLIDPTDFKLLNGNSLHKEIFDFIESTYKEKNNDPVFANLELPLLCDAIQFEKTCADIITNQGWEVRLTKRTGDQGADIICKKDSISVVCQVKLFTTKVGNKAVQEVLGAKEYYHSDYAVVIAKEGFTNSAIKLAACSNVLLLKFPDLEKFTIKVFSNL